MLLSWRMERDWPHARGIYHNDAKSALVWVNEEDHLRIISMEKGNNIRAVFDRFGGLVKAVEAACKEAGRGLEISEEYGNILSCPSNCGTGLRASMMIKIPLTTKQENFKSWCAERKLQARGSGGFASAAADDGIRDVSNVDRMGKDEVQLVNEMIQGVIDLINWEKELEAKAGGVSVPEAAAAAPASEEAKGGNPFTFASGLPDCCTASPESYKVIAELGCARLIEMRMAPGAEDKLHDHPKHSMYLVTPAKVQITPYTDGVAGEPQTVEMPAGAAPIMPPGAHQVKNVGDSEAVIIFIEALPSGQPCGDVEGFISPFTASPGCYKNLAEDDDWITAELSVEPGAIDELHHHRDHLIYVLEGEEITIYPDGDETQGNAVPLKVGMAVAAPMSAGPMFAKHRTKNTGSTALKMIFFEMKK